MKVLCITDRQDRPETEWFIRLARAVDAFTVMANPEGRYYPLLGESGLRVVPLCLRGRRDRAGSAAIRAEIARGDYDIVHAFNSRAIACMLRAGRGARARLLGYRGVTTGVGCLKPESWTTFLHPRLDGIACVADAVRRAFDDIHCLGWRFPAGKARTIRKGQDPRWYDGPAVAPAVLGVPAGARTLCCLSRNSPKKGVMTLLDAFDRLPETPDCHLLLLGGIDRSAAVRARISRCRRPDRVHLAGYRDDAVAVIRGSDVLVSASESGEGLPRVVFEAMCVDTPVVATDTGGTAELVINGETGLLVPRRDPAALAAAIERTLADPVAAARRAAAARARILAEFTPEQTARETVDWYRELLAR